MIPLFDTHQHLIYPQRFSYEWVSGIPVLNNQSFDIKAYQALAGSDNVASSLFMEAGVDKDFYRDETRFALELATNSDNRMAGIIAAAYPEDGAAFDEWLEETGSIDKIYGYRRILHVVDDEVSQDPLFRQNVRKIGALGKTFDMCLLQSQLDIGIQFAKACDNTQLILDHCGNPEVANDGFDVWRDKIKAFAELEHVACKISGVVNHCAEHQDPATVLKPYIEHIVECFGPDRCVWGGDWPVVKLAMDLPDWIAITRDIFACESVQNQEKIFNQNAQRIYNISP